MKLNNHDLEACAYIFEFDNGNNQKDFRHEVVEKSSVKEFDAVTLENIILNGLACDLYSEKEARGYAYWALSKRFNPKLIPYFTKWLKKEYDDGNSDGLYQIMIALNNLEAPIFGNDRTGYANFETELNYRDAKKYLKGY